VFAHVQPAQGRTAGRGRPALVTGVFLLVFSLALLVPPPASPDSPSTSTFSPSRPVDVLVQGRGAAAAVAAVGGRSLAALPIVDGLLARVPGGKAPELARQPEVRAVTDAERPLRVRAADPTAGPVDTPAPAPDGSATLPVGAPAPEGEGAARLGVGVGVLDTGISSNADLAGRVVASADLSGEWSFTDSYGHGTFMAGLIAGSGQGGGPAGIAPGADLIDLKVAGADGATTLGQVLAAMQLADAARDRFNLRVLNVSLGAPADDPATAPLTEAAERLWADGITVVAAAGNDGGGVDAPGLDPYVLTVGAVDGAGQVPAWSSRGPDFAGRAKPDLMAPGVGLVGLRAPGSTIDQANPSARVGDRYFRGSGTSMSTAVVAGAAARVLAAHPGWGPDRVKAALTGTADPLGPAAGSGAGALDLAAALGEVPDRVANGDLFPLRAVGRPGAPPPVPSEPLDGLGWRSGGADGLRWAPADELPGPTAGAGDTEAWTAHPWLSGRWAVDGWSAKSWAAQQWLARVWAARQWSAAGLAPAGWAVLQWSWGGFLAATLDGGGLGGTGLGGLSGTVDWAARSWAARSWAERAWGAGDLAARSWAARSWAELAWAARSWAARSWAAVDWTARSWASRRWTAGTWAAAGWSPPPPTAAPAARSWARRKR
jgi:serine protease AprX